MSSKLKVPPKFATEAEEREFWKIHDSSASRSRPTNVTSPTSR